MKSVICYWSPSCGSMSIFFIIGAELESDLYLWVSGLLRRQFVKPTVIIILRTFDENHPYDIVKHYDDLNSTMLLLVKILKHCTRMTTRGLCMILQGDAMSVRKKLHQRDVMMLIRRLKVFGWSDYQIWKKYRIPIPVIQKTNKDIER